MDTTVIIAALIFVCYALITDCNHGLVMGDLDDFVSIFGGHSCRVTVAYRRGVNFKRYTSTLEPR